MPNRSTRPTGHAPGSFAQELKAPRTAPAPKPERFLIALALDATRPSEDPAAFVARQLQHRAPNVDGSVTRQVAFGAWGTEEGVQILSTTIHRRQLLAAVTTLLVLEAQTCAYVEIDGEAFELRAGSVTDQPGTVGELVAIEGFVA
jgi:hypothetical protein